MAPVTATRRLRKELLSFQQDPPRGIIAEPKESDILTWYYALEGPKDTPYQEGIYVGKVIFPPEYPWKPPSIYMLTPSGRFEVNRKLCMSMSDFHPESWNPIWSVATILHGVHSFMASEEVTTGAVKATTAQRMQYAKASRAYNAQQFDDLFDGNMEGAFERAREAAENAERNRITQDASKEPRARKTSVSSTGSKVQSPAQKEGPQKETDAAQVLSEAEKEKRRKRNAKKRAKQKEKKNEVADVAGEMKKVDIAGTSDGQDS